MKKNTIITTFFLLIFLFCAKISDAQINLSGSPDGQSVFASNISIITTPSIPSPNQNVTVKIESFATDLNVANMAWYLDGELQSQKTGQKTFTFQTKSSGQTTELTVKIKTSEGFTISKHLSITPADVDLIWEANSYTPPFYKGKALYPHMGDIRIIAMPHIVGNDGKEINSKNLIYTWKKDGNVLGDSSGYGKDSLALTGKFILRPAQIEVEVTSAEVSAKARGALTYASVSPSIVLYQNSPSLGVLFNKSVSGSFSMANDEISLVGIPCDFSANSADDGLLKESWSMNGSAVSASKPNTLTLRIEADKKGTALISLEVSNVVKTLQFNKTEVSLNFDQSLTNNNVFNN